MSNQRSTRVGTVEIARDESQSTGCPIDDDGAVERALVCDLLLDVHPVHGLAGRPRLGGHERAPDELGCRSGGLLRTGSEPDATVGRAIARKNLRLDHAPLEAEPARHRAGLDGAGSDAATGDGNAEPVQKLLGLELVQVHWALLLSPAALNGR